MFVVAVMTMMDDHGDKDDCACLELAAAIAQALEWRRERWHQYANAVASERAMFRYIRLCPRQQQAQRPALT